MIQMAECLFWMRVLESKMEISKEKHLHIHIQSGVLHYIGIDTFNNSDDYNVNHWIGKVIT